MFEFQNYKSHLNTHKDNLYLAVVVRGVRSGDRDKDPMSTAFV